MNIFTEAEFTLFLKEINKSKMVFEIRNEEIFLCSTLNGYDEEVSNCELAKLSEQFLMEKLKIWININTKYYDIKRGNSLTLSIGSGNNFKYASSNTIIGFDEMVNFVEIKNKSIIDYSYQIFKSKYM
jgi:hypothetical protein